MERKFSGFEWAQGDTREWRSLRVSIVGVNAEMGILAKQESLGC